MTRGHFVVLEGIDGAGTTTHTGKLEHYLSHLDSRPASRVRVRATREPSDGPIGAFIRQVLTGRVVIPGGMAPGWETMALLFAADRMDHLQSEIEPFVEQGGIVISDRYDASSLAYQSVTSGIAVEEALTWIRSLNSRAPRPDLTIVLSISSETAAARRARRGEAAQIYEQNEVQRALAVFYKDIERYLPDDRIVMVDAEASVEVVHQRVVDAYRTAFSPRDE